MLHTRRKWIPTIAININMDNQQIVQVNSSTFLGSIDNNLTWKDLITKISQKISESIGIINRIRYLMPQNVLLNLYYSFVYPYLSYCNLVWHPIIPNG